MKVKIMSFQKVNVSVLKKNGLHSVTANGKFKMALLLVLE